MNNETFKKTAEQITHTVIEKNRAYGDSVNRAPQCLAILAPDGIQPHQYRDASLAVRLLDKIARGLAMPPGSDEENPWADAAGYCLIRANEVRIEAKRARFVRCSTPDSTEAEITEAAEILQWLAEHFGEGPELEELRSIGRFADFRRRNPPKSSPACACLNHQMSPPGECTQIEGHAGAHQWRTICGWQRAGNGENLICKRSPGHEGAHAFVEFGAVKPANPSEPEPAGVCGLENDGKVCLLHPGHRGEHFFEEVEDEPAPPSPQCLRPLGHEGICNR
jgi:hypothetical protein